MLYSIFEVSSSLAARFDEYRSGWYIQLQSAGAVRGKIVGLADGFRGKRRNVGIARLKGFSQCGLYGNI